MSERGKIYGRPIEPLPSISLGQMLLNKLRENGERVLVIDGYSGSRLTNRELLEKSVKLAKFLQTHGIKIGDRISIVSENRLNWLVPAFATFYLGAIVTPYNPAYTELEVRHMLNIAKPRVIFVSRYTEKLFVKILPSLPWSVQLIQLDDKPFTTNIRTLSDILNTTNVVDFMEYEAVKIGDNSKNAALILCSSGTTGLPKGVTLSDRNVLAFLTEIRKPEYLDVTPAEKMLLFLPFFHGYGLGTLLLCIINSNIVVIMPKFEPELFLRLIQEYRITYLPIVPAILTFLAKHSLVEKYDFRSVREIICGAAPLPKDLILEIKNRTGVQNFRNGYGMTELSVISNMSDRNEDDISCLHYLVPGLYSKIVDIETSETLDAGQVGEICFKGVQVMMGYWDNPDATKQTIDKDGWLHSGDVGYYDEQDNLHVIDRLKELIKYKAYQVSPSEIETVLLSLSTVKEAAVIGVPDEHNGELPMAFIMKQPGANVTAQDIMEFIKQKLSPQKWLRGGVQFVDAIPKNPTGKILRRELRKLISKL